MGQVGEEEPGIVHPGAGVYETPSDTFLSPRHSSATFQGASMDLSGPWTWAATFAIWGSTER